MAIRICIADNHPVVHCGLQAFFQKHPEISIIANSYDFAATHEILASTPIDVLILDLELKDLSSINMVRELIRAFPGTKVILFTSLSEHIYTSNAIKAGVAGFLQKTEELFKLEFAILKAYQGESVFNSEIQRKLQLAAGQRKSDRLYRKLSTRELEVLRYLSEGKKNNEISRVLGLNEKTISTYKLRLLTKLNVTNLVDLIKKARALEIL